MYRRLTFRGCHGDSQQGGGVLIHQTLQSKVLSFHMKICIKRLDFLVSFTQSLNGVWQPWALGSWSLLINEDISSESEDRDREWKTHADWIVMKHARETGTPSLLTMSYPIFRKLQKEVITETGQIDFFSHTGSPASFGSEIFSDEATVTGN